MSTRFLATLTHDYPSAFSYRANIEDKLSPNNTANTVVADDLSCRSDGRIQQFAQLAEALDAILRELERLMSWHSD
jgi:hypothetical protein